MHIYNDADISFTGPLPDDVIQTVEQYLKSVGLDSTVECGNDEKTGNGYLYVSSAMGNIRDNLNQIVEYTRPHGVKPEIHSYNRYAGDYDGFDLFTGEIFEVVDVEDFSLRTASDAELTAILERRSYKVTVAEPAEKPTTGFSLWDRLLQHRGHELVVVTYGNENDPADVCLECENCSCVVLDAEIYDLCTNEQEEHP